MKAFKILFLIGLFFLVSCQTQPTKVNEKLTTGPEKIRSVIIQPNTVVLDVRPYMQYMNGHLPNARHVQVDHFFERKVPFKGLILKDLSSITKRLSLLGVDPSKTIVVVGQGENGQGEEGRMAWLLSYLGVNDVSFIKESSLQLKRVSGEPGLFENVEVWKPQVNPELLVTKKEILAISKAPQSNSATLILDVRTQPEYLKQDSLKPRWTKNIMNISWQEFILENGRPDPTITARLESVGVTRARPIVVISDQGVRSALVTMALRELGFTQVANFAGGYQELVGRSQ